MYSRGGGVCVRPTNQAVSSNCQEILCIAANLFPLCGGKASKEARVDKFIAALRVDPQYQYHICLGLDYKTSANGKIQSNTPVDKLLSSPVWLMHLIKEKGV